MQGTGSFRLIVRRGPQPNQIYELNKDVITLGRDITNDIVINDPEVSRHHCRITRSAGGYTLEDLGSTNGTFVSGQRLMGPRPLSSGDQIGLGETVTLSYESTIPAPVDLSARPPMQAAPGVPTAPPVQPQQPYVPPGQPYAPGGGYAPSDAGQGQQYAQQTAYTPTPPPPPQYQQYQYPENTLGEATGLNRWFFIGCGCLIVLCIVLAVVAAFYIDANDLYCRIPLLREAVGIIRRCP
jgi:pSer/pThr/pTyr-binding forkhead associated (FHA) protein